MASQGYEHSNIEGVIQAFEIIGKPVFMILRGSTEPVLTVEESNFEDAKTQLQNMLEMIENSGTATTYTLRVYNERTRNITNKTPYGNSTRFNLSTGRNTVVDPNTGLKVIAYDRGTGNGLEKQQASESWKATGERVRILEEENAKLRERLHRAELDNMEIRLKNDFHNKISGLENQQKTWQDRLGDLLDKVIEKPEVVGEFIQGFKKGKAKDFTINHSPISGTRTNEVEQDPEEEEEPEEDENSGEMAEQTANTTGPMANPFLAEGEENLRESKQRELTWDRIQTIQDEEKLEEVQIAALDNITERIGWHRVTQMLLTVACLDKKDLNKLLSHLE
jgi:hypothetical protein